jgi:hypothetical protein
MTIIKKDILTVERGIICQQVNCMGVMGSGLAKSIRDKWPQVFTTYSDFCKGRKPGVDLLGEMLPVKVGEDLWVANIFSQYDYNRDGSQIKHTEYGALHKALRELPKNRDIYFPYLIGAFRGGGDWRIISEIIDFHFPKAIVCQL